MKLGQIIDELYNLRAKKAELNSSIKGINASMDELSTELIKKLDEEKTIKASGTKASASLKEDIVPSVTDWDEVYKYIVENDACYILEKRMSVAAFRELQNLNTPIPGTEPFVKRSISLRKV